MPYVSIHIPHVPMRRVDLGDVNTFGRSPRCDVWINEPNVSRRHCRIQCVGGKWVLTDLKSTNGTWLDAARVRRYALRDGESFYIGDARIVFHADARVEHRPADPVEAQHCARIAETPGTLADTSVGGRLRRPLPAPRATVAVRSRRRGASSAVVEGDSVAFRRPRARPIVRPVVSGGRVGSFVSRLCGQ